MAVYGVDTHALWWYLQGNPALGKRAKAVMDDAESVLLIPAVVLAELEMHDSLICATCLDWQLTVRQPVSLITKDEQITKSAIVPVIW